MKKIDWKYKLLLLILGSGILFSLLFFSFQYNWHISYILSDIVYFPINAFTYNSNQIHLEGINFEKEEELENLKELINIKDTLSEYETISATVINRNYLYWNNEIVINRGKKSGIEEGMAVIDGKGLIGKVISVSLTTARIRLITSNDINNKISVKIWINNNPINKVLETDQNNLLFISGIDNKEDIKEGDLITTSGLSDIFPSGIDIGHVEKIENDKYGISKKAYINPSSDLDNLRFVFVLKRKI